MRTAVVGGNGFIGRAFTEFAAENGHEPVVIGSEYNVFSEDGERAVKDILRKCGAMVFLAAKRTTKSFSMQEYIYNVSLADKYFRYAQEAAVKNIVTISSISVYSSGDLPWREEDFQSPLSLYGASKQAVDGLALWYNAHQGMKIKSLRLAQVIGMGERKGYLLNTLIDNAAAGKKQTIFGKGTGRRQYIYIGDVCDVILHSLTAEKDNAGVFNIGIAGNVSIRELAELVNEVFGNTAGLEIREDQPEDTRQYLMDVGKAERELHWKPGYDLKGAFVDIRDHV